MSRHKIIRFETEDMSFELDRREGVDNIKFYIVASRHKYTGSPIISENEAELGLLLAILKGLKKASTLFNRAETINFNIDDETIEINIKKGNKGNEKTISITN